MVTQQDLQDLVYAASIAGFTADITDLTLLTWDAGIATHNPLALPAGFSAVYIFKNPDECLKVGKAGRNSAPRYLSHHYHITAPSTLARSLINDPLYTAIIGEQIPRDWIRTNTSRYNILIPNIYGKHFLNFAEAFFILKCTPRYEGS